MAATPRDAAIGAGAGGRPLVTSLVVLLLAGALAACSSAPAPSGGAAASGAAASGTGSNPSASTGQVPAGSGAQQSLAAGPLPPVGDGEFVASDPASGLTDLTSYTATLTKSFQGTVDGAAQQWSSTITLSVGAAGTHLAVVTTGTGALETDGELYDVGGVAYQVAGGSDCTAGAVEEPGGVRTAAEPAAELYAVVGGTAAGDESVNGVPATKVTFDDRAIGLAGLVHATGALWSAKSGGYLVRYTLDTDGGPEFFGPGASGTERWQYELTDINQPVAIELPHTCPAGHVAADVMPGATDVADAPGLLSYSVSGSIADAMAFYRSRAAGKGWTVLRDPLMTDDIGILELKSADGLLTVIATPGDAGSVTVHVALDRGA